MRLDEAQRRARRGFWKQKFLFWKQRKLFFDVISKGIMNRVLTFKARPAEHSLSGSGVGDERRYTPFRYPRELEQQRRAGIVAPTAPPARPGVPSGISRAGHAAAAALLAVGAAAAGVAARRYMAASPFDDVSEAQALRRSYSADPDSFEPIEMAPLSGGFGLGDPGIDIDDADAFL